MKLQVISFSRAGDLSTFFGGLEAKIGPPRPTVRDAMTTEHIASSDSLDLFTTGNYGITTSPQVEWYFVTEPERNESWPSEEKLRVSSPERMRKPMPLAEMEKLLSGVNQKLAAIGEKTGLLTVEAFGARL